MLFIYYLKIIITILFIFIYEFFLLKPFKKIKVCICTIGKKENLYAREYVNYYQNMGINKIFIYDNNDKNGENFELVLKDYIDNGFVEILDVRGKIAAQINAMEDCRKNNYKKFDWLIFFDMDEFIFLKNYSNVLDFLNQNIFDKCQIIQLNWFIHTDNNLLYYDNRTLRERFPEKIKEKNGKLLPGCRHIKSILKGNIDIKIRLNHELNNKLITCDGFGHIINNPGVKAIKTDHSYYYIDHYWSKSTEEFVNKLIKGDAILGFKNKENNMNRINMYFAYNKITKEKIDYIENRTNYNLTKFRLMLTE